MKQEELLFRGKYENNIINEFEFEGMKYVYYSMHSNNHIYITGDKYDWKTGLVFSPEIGHVCEIYYIEDRLRILLEAKLKKI